MLEKLPEFIGNHIFLVSLFIAILAILIWNLFSSTISGIAQVPPGELTRLMNRENAIVIDVRSSAEFSKGHILNARNIPDGELETHKKDLEKHKSNPLVTCCGSGALSQKAARILKAMGFEKVYILKGGIQAWQSANLPLTRDGKKV